MKKYILLAALALGILSGCEKEEFKTILGEKPEERMYKALAEYEEELISHEFGWKAYLYADGGVGAGFYMQFGDNDRVKMLSDLSEAGLSVYKESGYRLKAVMAPTLIFDTDNYLHLLANPDPSEFGGASGSGYQSDFEFEFRGHSNDTLELLGKKRRSKLLLVKATQAEQVAYLDGTFKERMLSMVSYLTENPYLFIEPTAGERVQMSINTGSREVALTWIESGQVKNAKQPFAFSVNGIHLKDTLSYNNTHIKEILWAEGFEAKTFSGASEEVNISPAPLVPLHMLMGSQYSGIYFPQTAVPGSSPGFNTMWQQYVRDIGPGAPGSYTFNYGDLEMIFDTINDRFTLNFFVSQNGGSSGWVTTYPYSYTIDDEGVYTLTLNRNGITGPRYDEVEASAFVNKFNGMKMKLDFHVSGSTIYGKFIDANDPSFFGVGILN